MADWRSLFDSMRHFLMRGLLPFLGGVAMTWAFGQSAWDMFDENYGETSIGGVGGVFILGVGMLVLGVPLMLACYAHRKEFFQGKTLTAETEVLVPDVY